MASPSLARRAARRGRGDERLCCRQDTPRVRRGVPASGQSFRVKASGCHSSSWLVVPGNASDLRVRFAISHDGTAKTLAVAVLDRRPSSRAIGEAVELDQVIEACGADKLLDKLPEQTPAEQLLEILRRQQ